MTAMIRKTVPARQPAVTSPREWTLLAGVSLLLLAARMVYVQWLSPYGLSPDEAQYWTWLAHNDLSFLTKPPLTTWLMGISTAFLGQTMLGVKLFALVGQVAVAAFGWLIAREVAGKAAAWWAWGLLTTPPLLAAGGLLMTPDAVLTPLWLLAIHMVVRALRPGVTDAEALCWRRWLLIGVVVGFGGLAKYSAAFFYPLLGVFLLIWRREWLLKPQVWVSGLVALALQLPVVIWNVQHDWVGITHVLWQVDNAEDNRHGGITTLLEFIGGQALVLGPLALALVMAAWLATNKRLAKLRPLSGHTLQEALLLVFSLPLFAGFILLTLMTKVQPNWPVLSTTTALLLCGVWLGHMKARWVVWLGGVALAVNVFLSVLLLDTYTARDMGLLPVKAKNDPTKDLRGWPELGNILGLMLYKLDRPVLLASRYQTLAPMVFHTLGHPEWTYVNAEGRRLNAYDVWPKPDLRGRLVVYVNEQNVLPDGIKTMFGACEPWHSVAVEDHDIVTRRVGTWLCWGERPSGLKPANLKEQWAPD